MRAKSTHPIAYALKLTYMHTHSRKIHSNNNNKKEVYIYYSFLACVLMHQFTEPKPLIAAPLIFMHFPYPPA